MAESAGILRLIMQGEFNIRRGWLRWYVILALWTLLAAFAVSQSYVYSVNYDRPFEWGQMIIYRLTYYYSWALLTPLILLLARRYRIERQRLKGSLPIHGIISLIIAPLQMSLATFFNLYISEAISVHRPGLSSNPQAIKIGILAGSFDSLITYWVILGIYYTFDYYLKYREHRLRTSQLEAQLAQAELQALKMQLQPHFLFNTLHAISTLIHKDVEAADRMIARLSELLRTTLESVGVQEVSLKQELEFLESYLEIEQTRFQDRLTVLTDIDPETLDARVPNLILQPLVENAIRHGIAPRSSAGRIEIHAKRDNSMLQIQILDDGPGLSKGGGGMLSEGVGLANTRARLQQLYGTAHRFELRNAGDGGLIVSLMIPYVVETDGAEESEGYGNGENSNTDSR